MGVMQKTAIIIPCFNEELRFDSSQFSESSRKNSELKYIFVNDGSTDKTEEKLDKLCRTNPSGMQYITLTKNSGKAEAVRQGFLYAFERDFENIGYWDADLATPLRIIPTFCDILESPGINMVIGSRVRLLGRNIQRRATRHYLGRLFATGASTVLGLPVYDTQCGAKIFKNRKELRLVFSRPFSVRWTFDVEILARFILIDHLAGMTSLKDTSVEYPLEEWCDVSGSKINKADFLVGAIELFKIFRFLHFRGAKRKYMGLFTELNNEYNKF